MPNGTLPSGVRRSDFAVAEIRCSLMKRLQAAHKTLRARRDIIDDLIARHEGCIVSTAGQSSLTEFNGPMRASSL